MANSSGTHYHRVNNVLDTMSKSVGKTYGFLNWTFGEDDDGNYVARLIGDSGKCVVITQEILDRMVRKLTRIDERDITSRYDAQLASSCGVSMDEYYRILRKGCDHKTVVGYINEELVKVLLRERE